jgi:NAD(P)-dependent dehydrogenase (short-subunit alcohol dehydrogenase family)
MSDFIGKNILVLGGSRGIGAAIVRRFASGGGKMAFSHMPDRKMPRRRSLLRHAPRRSAPTAPIVTR